MTNIPSDTGRLQRIENQAQASPPVKESRPVKAAKASLAQALPEVARASGAQQPRPQPSAEELKRITEELRRRVSAVSPELEFQVDRSSGRVVVKITDPATKEVIRQIPSEEMLEINKALEQFQQGLLLNRKA